MRLQKAIELAKLLLNRNASCSPGVQAVQDKISTGTCCSRGGGGAPASQELRG